MIAVNQSKMSRSKEEILVERTTDVKERKYGHGFGVKESKYH